MRLHDLFASKSEMVLVLELMRGGELFDFIAEKEMLSEEEAIGFLAQILRGVQYLHARHIAHFDLKPENIMLQDKEVPEPQIKIIDFGLAQKLEDGVTFKSLCGTPQYIGTDPPPAGLGCGGATGPQKPRLRGRRGGAGGGSRDRAPTLGVPAPLMCAPPGSAFAPSPRSDQLRAAELRDRHVGETDAETLSNVLDGAYEFEEHHFSQTSEMAKDFIRQLLVKEPRERMTASECLVHPWIKPLSRKQAAKRSRSSINMKNFRKFNARRKWKLSYNMVSACNRLCRMRLLCGPRTEDEELRGCESEQEDEGSHPATLLRRRRSSCS
ncbi:Death-associated protein kinase 2-like isoform X1 [Aix galericulata]|nr:Death-associated protein kinase 2-like isoform X1 [Aix galericulata]